VYRVRVRVRGAPICPSTASQSAKTLWRRYRRRYRRYRRRYRRRY
jgi:hypothetical protein